MHFCLCYVMGRASVSWQTTSAWPRQESLFPGSFSVFTSVKWESKEALSDTLKCFIHHLDY